TYTFRATFRTVAPVWYHGRLWSQPGTLEPGEVTVVVAPLVAGARAPEPVPLVAVPGGPDLQATVHLTMPTRGNVLPLLVQFRRGEELLEPLDLNLDVVQPQ